MLYSPFLPQYILCGSSLALFGCETTGRATTKRTNTTKNRHNKSRGRRRNHQHTKLKHNVIFFPHHFPFFPHLSPSPSFSLSHLFHRPAHTSSFLHLISTTHLHHLNFCTCPPPDNECSRRGTRCSRRKPPPSRSTGAVSSTRSSSRKTIRSPTSTSTQ